MARPQAGQGKGPYYTLCLSERALYAEMRRNEIPEHIWPAFPKSGAQLDTFTHPKEDDIICVVSMTHDPEREPIVLAGLLIHEATHIWQRWLDHVGEKDHGREAEAYAIQWLSQQLMWEYVRQTKRRKR